MMAEPWAHDQYVKVVKNEDYYGGAPNIDGVDYMILADQDTAFLEFQAGNIDFTHIPTGQIESSIQEYGESGDGYTVAPGEQVLLGPETATYYILFNNTNETLSDPAVRAALSLAIDRQRISDTIFEGTRDPATGIVPPGIVGFQDDAWEYSYYDAEAAAAKLEEAGYPEGEGLPTIMLEFNSGSGHEDIMQLIQDDWAQIGVTAELAGTEWAQYLDKLLEGTYMTGRLGWIADYPIMDNFLYPLFTTDSTDNFAFYSNEDVDSTLSEARQTTDADERVALYQEVETTIGADAPVAPVMFYKHTRVGSDRLRDAIFSPQGLMNFEELWLSE
jgi:ABC-type transport system substrate-binding protein